MGSVTATAARKDIYNLIASVNENCTPISITTSKGKGAVLVGEDEWAAIEETLFLNNIPGVAESIVNGMNTPVSECCGEDELEWQVVWKVVFTKQAQKDAKKLKASGLDAKAKALIEVVKVDPFAKTPAYESLKGNLEGAYSRRINFQHRFVYEVIPAHTNRSAKNFDGIVKVIRVWTHYEKIQSEQILSAQVFELLKP